MTRGKTVKAHFDCYFRGIDAASSRQARFMNENVTLPEPLEFIAGNEIKIPRSREYPLPPQALTIGVIGMQVGGKRSLLVPAEPWGYGEKGRGEIPPGQTFELQIELLELL